MAPGVVTENPKLPITKDIHCLLLYICVVRSKNVQPASVAQGAALQLCYIPGLACTANQLNVPSNIFSDTILTHFQDLY